MKKIYTLFTACSFYTSFLAQSPITLGNANMPGSGDTLRYSNAQLNSAGNYTQTGANFNWNFSSLVLTSQGIRAFKSGLQTPYALFFLSLNEYGEKISDTIGAGPLTITNFYDFYKKQTSPNAYIADGAGMTFSSIPVPNYYSDKDELYNFPMSYPKYDSTTFKFSTPTTSLIPITYSKSGYRVTVVDGWGSVTTPYGTENCLRLITTQYSMDSIKSSIIPFTFGFPDYQRSYQWLTTASKIPFLEVSGNVVGANFTPTQVRYRDGYRTMSPPTTGTYTAIQEQNDIQLPQFYPNPVKDKLALTYINAGKRTFAIYDLNGRQLKTSEPELVGQLQLIDVSGFEKGIYMLKVTEDGRENYFKFIKE
jgi:hypothetical protein